MNRPSEKDRTPQTFDEWREAWVPAESGHNFDSYGMRAAWNAALASQQSTVRFIESHEVVDPADVWDSHEALVAEVKRLREGKSFRKLAENTRLKRQLERAEAELRAAREVVDGARELRDIARAQLKAGTFAANPEMTDALLMLDESLDAYDRLTTSEDKADD